MTVILGEGQQEGERKVTKIIGQKKMLREKKLQVVRILAGGKVEARVVSNRQLFLSITNSSTNCSFLVDTTSHHGEFVSDHLKNCNHSQF